MYWAYAAAAGPLIEVGGITIQQVGRHTELIGELIRDDDFREDGVILVVIGLLGADAKVAGDLEVAQGDDGFAEEIGDVVVIQRGLVESRVTPAVRPKLGVMLYVPRIPVCVKGIPKLKI